MADVEQPADEASRAADRERKKAEVRKRLEEQGKAGKKAKKGFLTPDRKKKLRKLLMVKAAEDLKRQQLLKEQERSKILQERTISLPNIDNVDDHDQLEKIYNDLFAHVVKLEEAKYDINRLVTGTDSEINALTIAVNDLRGKFVKPSLKKVSKYDNKFKKMEAAKEGAGAKEDFRSNLKVVKKAENVIDDVLSKKQKSDKPDWSKDAKKKEEEKPKEEAPPPPAEEPAAAEPEAPAEEPEEAEEGEEGEEGEDEEEEEEE